MIGCNIVMDSIFTEACSHGRSHAFFAESINTNVGFYARSCDQWNGYVDANCKEFPILMGEHVPRNVRGNYYLRTGSEPPYALGLP